MFPYFPCHISAAFQLYFLYDRIRILRHSFFVNDYSLFSLICQSRSMFVIRSCPVDGTVCLVYFQNAGAIIGKGGANIKRLRTDVSRVSCLMRPVSISPPKKKKIQLHSKKKICNLMAGINIKKTL